MDNTVVVAVVNGVFALGVAGLAYQNTRIEKRAKENHEVLKTTAKDVAKIENRTNGVLDAKIRNAVRDVFKEHFPDVTSAVVAESLNDLLTQIILSNGEEEIDVRPNLGRRKQTRLPD